MQTSLKKSVPSAVAPSTGNSVPVLTEPVLGPYEPMKGSARVPEVPVHDQEGMPRAQPGFGGFGGNATQLGAGNTGAPSVPVDGFLFKPGPIDVHYQNETQASNPYAKVNNPPTRGMFTWVKAFVNHIATSQDVDNTGFRARHPQQRTSYMRAALPPHGAGYAPETFIPRQLPQHPNTYKFNPATGTGPFGAGVLNSSTLGAGQTAGGIGGNQYTPTPGPPATTSTAGNVNDTSGMPTWG